MGEVYKMNIAGCERELPICPLNEHMDIAGFVMFSDVEITERAAQALLDSGAFSDALDTVDQDTAAALYGIDADTITGSAVYTSLSAGAEEIAVLVLTDEDAAAAALDGLEARVADQKAVLESYQPDEVSKLDSAIVEQRGNSVLLAVAADAEKARAALDGLE